MRGLQVGEGIRSRIRGIHDFQGLNRGQNLDRSQKNRDRGQSFKFGIGSFVCVCTVPSNVLDIL